MKYLILAAMLLTTNAFGQTASKIPSVEVGGRTFTNTGSELIQLFAFVRSANGFTPLRTPEGVTYTPSGANNFRVLAVKFVGGGAHRLYRCPSGSPQAEEAAGPCGGGTFFGAFNIGNPFAPGQEFAINWLINNGDTMGFASSSAGGVLYMYGFEEAP